MVNSEARYERVVPEVSVAESQFSMFDEAGCVRLKLEGSVRVETAVLLKRDLSRAQIAHDVAIDWEQAEHVDASVFQVLLALRQSLSEKGLTLTVETDNPHVRQYLELSDLSRYFPLRPAPRSATSPENPNA